VRLAEKISQLDGRTDFAAWFRTTWLPYTQRVPEPLRDEFIAAVVDRYLAKHPPDPGGRVSVKMVRLEIEATRVGTPGSAAGQKPDVHGRVKPESCDLVS
jgi:trans-aconitate 2-methyltransferase